jgi:DNA-binding GntR family transcriptional regulator
MANDIGQRPFTALVFLMSNNSPITRTAAPLRQQVVRLVREDILNGILVPGQRLFESALCESLGVSRTVIREALRQLESEYLIQVRPNLGPIVTILNEVDIKSLYIVRAAREGLVGKLFALNASDAQCQSLAQLRDRLDSEYRLGDVDSREAIKAEFYERLADGAGNAILAENLNGMHARVAVFRRYAFVDPTRIERSIRTIEKIIQAAAVDRDPEAAWRECESHVLIAADFAVMEHLKRLPGMQPGKKL